MGGIWIAQNPLPQRCFSCSYEHSASIIVVGLTSFFYFFIYLKGIYGVFKATMGDRIWRFVHQRGWIYTSCILFSFFMDTMVILHRWLLSQYFRHVEYYYYFSHSVHFRHRQTFS